MAKIAFILLCHKDPDAIILQAERLTAAGDYLSIHFDASAPPAAFDQIQSALAGNPSVTFATKRIKCGWGEWSLVQATLHAVEAALAAFPNASHLYMVSGDCMPIKSADYLHDLLDGEDADYIESFDYFESNWIKTGFREERLIYRHWFNERTQKGLFYASFNLQRRFGLTRDIPAELSMMIGSQWWCLRRRTVEAVLAFAKKRPEVQRFFRTTWIPDETYFQTLVRHLVPGTEIRSRTLTFLMFTDYGMPATFYNDHYDLLLGQDAVTDLPAVDFLFDEEATALPDLGGIETSLDKRARHRRALIRMLFDRFDRDELVICLDPSNFDLIEDLLKDKADVRLLEIACSFPDAYLEGHAKRIGLAKDDSPADLLARLIPTVRNDIAYESERIRDAGFTAYERILDTAAPVTNATVLARFLGVGPDTARALAETPHLFSD